MSWEGLADAVVKLRNLAEASESALQGAFSFMGNWSAAGGDFPAAPAEGTGSQQYRISVAGTMGGRAYRVGEQIYYDQFTSQWRPLTEALGSAAFATVTTSATDTTAGRLMKVGDFGLGATGNTAVFGGDLGAINTTQFLNCGPSTTGGPAGVNIDGAKVLHAKWADTNSATQILWTYNGATYERHITGGTLLPWLQTLKLDAAGNFSIGNSSAPNIAGYLTQSLDGVTGSFTDYRQSGANGLRLGADSGNGFINGAAGILRLLTSDIERMRIDSSGKLTSANGAAFVGTVAQGGNQSAIIQRGSNANGGYVRFADGTQICFTNRQTALAINNPIGNLFWTGSNLWTLPVSFVAPPTVSVSEAGGAGGCWGGLGTGGTDATTTTFALYRGTLENTQPIASLIAIGRWY
ncbi:hypothetical protein [Arsukibacterium sp.]|uniref:hypothetical protein n=1 Tax=Arsukibacterium sp. TaxID=1977258 RepID=UPI00299D2E66|nr:hypothetical protein [Arsukibacterium sp.]MDX1538818.1 hypothetical protein [Arsukibacterium sp.]